MQTLRFAPAAVAACYPLAITGETPWTRDAAGWSTTIELPDLPNDCIVVPSFTQPGTARVDFVAALRAQDAAWTLEPTMHTDHDRAACDPRATTHIGYFHCRTDLRAPRLTITVAGPLPPYRYLVTVGSRAFRRTTEPGTATTQRLVVPAISQLTAPTGIRHRICSPASLAMVLAYHRADVSLAAVTRDCFHAPSHLFGVWPLAVRTATDAGLLAAVECFTELDAAAPIFDRGLPIVASIRFAAGALPGSPMQSTDGHLVVVTGMDHDWVYVNDPAARDASEVPRQYPRAAFAAAWLSERGVAYVLSRLC